MKKAIKVFAAMTVCVMMAACSSGGAGGTGTENQESSKTDNGAAASIDLTVDGGSIKYVGFEKAHPDLTEEEDDYVFYFDFTNNVDEPQQSQNVFTIQFFQNGAELKKSVSWSGKAGEQYDVVSAYFNDALKGGTIHFGRIVIVDDNSPITILVKDRNDSKTSQMMEVDISGAGGTSTTGEAETEKNESLTADEVENLVSGRWVADDGSGEVSFDAGSIVFTAQGQMLSGTYEVETEQSAIIGHLPVSDGQSLKITIPYTYEDGNFVIYNNSGGTFTKQN